MTVNGVQFRAQMHREQSSAVANACSIFVIALEFLRLVIVCVNLVPALLTLAGVSALDTFPALAGTDVSTLFGASVLQILAQVSWFFLFIIVVVVLNEVGDRYFWVHGVLGLGALAYGVVNLAHGGWYAHKIWTHDLLGVDQEGVVEAMVLAVNPDATVLPDWVVASGMLGVIIIGSLLIARSAISTAVVHAAGRQSPWGSTAL